MRDAESGREARLRRLAKSKGLDLRKSRSRIAYFAGTYGLVDAHTNMMVTHDGQSGFGLSLDEVEKALAVGRSGSFAVGHLAEREPQDGQSDIDGLGEETSNPGDSPSVRKDFGHRPSKAFQIDRLLQDAVNRVARPGPLFMGGYHQHGLPRRQPLDLSR